MEYISLKPDRKLLNAKFESYHLGTVNLELRSRNLLQPVAHDPLSEDHYSFSHLRAHAEQNLLVLDLWNKQEDVLYFVDSTYAVMGVSFDKSSGAYGSPVTMCKFSVPPEEKINEHISPSASFPSPTVCFFSDGTGKLFFAKTGNRSIQLEKQNWQSKEAALIKDFGFPFYLRQCCQQDDDNIYCLLLSLEDEKMSSSSHPQIFLHLVHLIHSKNGSNSAGDEFIVNDTKVLSGTSIPVYSTYSPDFSSLIIASQKPFTFGNKESSEQEEEKNGGATVPANDEEKVAEPDTVADALVPPTTYTNEQMEECDIENEEDLKLVVIDRKDESTKLETQVAGHQWLFNRQFDPNEPASFCVRHDVDGLLWKPIQSETKAKVTWKHMTTFNALGYIQASKKNHKYTICGSDYKFVAIVDCVSNIYIYVTGEIASNDGCQYVIELPTTEEILGVQASDRTLFLLTKRSLFAVNVL